MAEIVLGLGTSHSPMLLVEPEQMVHYPDWDVRLPLLDRDGEPTTYERQVANADARVAAALTPEHLTRRSLLATSAIANLADAVATAKLDALIVIGDDQKELFDETNNPALLVYWGEQIRNNPAKQRQMPPWLSEATARYYEPSEPRDYPVAQDLAQHLIDSLLDNDFDVATASHLPEGKGEGHAFSFVHTQLMTQVVVPIVPVMLNTYYPPNQPSPRRCYQLGQAIAAAVRTLAEPMRVGVVASGGLSHFTVDEDFDRSIVAALKANDGEALRSLPRNKLNSGSSEIRNWIATAGALEHLSIDWLEYLPGYRSPAGTGTGLCFAVWR